MTIQTLTYPATICSFLVAPSGPIQASSRDYGFDFDEEEIGTALLAPLPEGFSTQPASEGEAEASESGSLCFIS